MDGRQLDPGYGFLVSNVESLGNRGTTAAIADFLRRTTVARLWANDHVTRWASLYAQVSGLSVEQATETERNSVATYVPIDDSVRRAEQDAADAFTNAGLIPTRVDISRYLDTRFNGSTS